MNQEEFFQSNQVDGKLTDEQMAQMLSLPEGDTASAEISVPDADDATKTPTDDAGNKVETVEPVILAKDGVHTIPFSKLEEARQGEQHWKSLAAEQQRQLDELSKKPAVEIPPANAVDIDAKEQEYFDAMMEGDGDKAKAIRQEINQEILRQSRATVSEALAPIQQQREISATEAHFKAIAAAHPDYESVGQSQELTDWIAKQPSFARSGYEKVIAEGTAQEAIELFDAFKAATGKVTATPGRPDASALAKAAIENAKTKPPTSLSEIPAGSGVPSDEASAMLEMTATGLMGKFEGKTPEQINAMLNRII